jgi:hypothetical protein
MTNYLKPSTPLDSIQPDDRALLVFTMTRSNHEATILTLDTAGISDPDVIRSRCHPIQNHPAPSALTAAGRSINLRGAIGKRYTKVYPGLLLT